MFIFSFVFNSSWSIFSRNLVACQSVLYSDVLDTGDRIQSNETLASTSSAILCIVSSWHLCLVHRALMSFPSLSSRHRIFPRPVHWSFVLQSSYGAGLGGRGILLLVVLIIWETAVKSLVFLSSSLRLMNRWGVSVLLLSQVLPYLCLFSAFPRSFRPTVQNKVALPDEACEVIISVEANIKPSVSQKESFS